MPIEIVTMEHRKLLFEIVIVGFKGLLFEIVTMKEIRLRISKIVIVKEVRLGIIFFY